MKEGIRDVKGEKQYGPLTKSKQRPFNGFLGTYKQKGQQLDSFPVYIYDLLKYNEIRVGRGLIYFVQNAACFSIQDWISWRAA